MFWYYCSVGNCSLLPLVLARVFYLSSGYKSASVVQSIRSSLRRSVFTVGENTVVQNEGNCVNLCILLSIFQGCIHKMDLENFSREFELNRKTLYTRHVLLFVHFSLVSFVDMIPGKPFGYNTLRNIVDSVSGLPFW